MDRLPTNYEISPVPLLLAARRMHVSATELLVGALNGQISLYVCVPDGTQVKLYDDITAEESQVQWNAELYAVRLTAPRIGYLLKTGRCRLDFAQVGIFLNRQGQLAEIRPHECVPRPLEQEHGYMGSLVATKRTSWQWQRQRWKSWRFLTPSGEPGVEIACESTFVLEHEVANGFPDRLSPSDVGLDEGAPMGLIGLYDAYKRFWARADVIKDEADTHPGRKQVEEWLMTRYSLGKEAAEQGASIIKPSWAKQYPKR